VLALTCGCIRFGYDRPEIDAAMGGRDAAPQDAADQAGAAGAGTGGPGGRAGSTGSGGTGGAGRGGTGNDAGVDVDQKVGDTGLKVSDILGFYSGDWGDMVLRKQGEEIWGVYAHDGGTIVGRIMVDGVFLGWWSQTPTRTGSNAGEVEFRWSQASGTAIALDGRWRYGATGDWLENWDITLVTDRAAPTELTDQFSNSADFVRHP
jgi:hypothetical protein